MNYFLINKVVVQNEKYSHPTNRVQLSYTIYEDPYTQYVFDILIFENVEYVAYPADENNIPGVVPYFSRTIIFALRFIKNDIEKKQLSEHNLYLNNSNHHSHYMA